MQFISITLLFLLFSCNLLANDFVSTKSNKINMRTGPGFHYPVKWVYIRQNVPLKVMEEFEIWKKVCDINEDCGWIKGNLLSSKCYVMTKEDTTGYKKQNVNSSVTMKIDKFAVLKLEKCIDNWCLLSASKRKAWVQRQFLWGI